MFHEVLTCAFSQQMVRQNKWRMCIRYILFQTEGVAVVDMKFEQHIYLTCAMENIYIRRCIENSTNFLFVCLTHLYERIVDKIYVEINICRNISETKNKSWSSHEENSYFRFRWNKIYFQVCSNFPGMPEPYTSFILINEM